VSAFLTGAAVTSGPWLLTTLVLVLMRISAGVADISGASAVITVVFAVVIVLSAPIDIVLSRFAADRVYARRRDRIAAPLRLVLAACLPAFTLVGALAMVLLGATLELGLPGALLAGVIGAQWLLLSAAGGLSSPGIILRAFAIGAPVSVLGAHLLSRFTTLGAVGYLYGFGAGQVATLALLLWGTFRALPPEEDESARILPAFREYWLLAAAALAFHAGIWVDKLVVMALGGAQLAATYAATAAVAWLSVIPACAYLFVKVETGFSRRFRSFYAALHTGASLPDLERMARELGAEVGRVLRGTGAVQACVTLGSLLAAPLVVEALGLSAGDPTTLRWLLLGAALQVLGLSATLLLYYFDFRFESFLAAAVQLGANGLLTLLLGAPSRSLGAGYSIACALSATLAIGLLHRRMTALLLRTFQSQPYASET